MGYRLPSKILRLTFDEHEGLVVRARSVSVEEFLALVRMPTRTPGQATDEEADSLANLFATFADALVDWNLEDEDGTPVPATLAGVKALEHDFALGIINGWQKAMGGVSAPLPETSPGGAPALAGSIPMEPLSASRASS